MRLVRSAKRHLKFLFDKDNLDIDVFETALTQVSAILNSRPLTHASTSVDDMRTLSPADFLYPYTITPSYTTILPPIPAGGDHMRAAWREVRRITEEFRIRWKTEYVQSLLSRPKWKKGATPLYEGQLVILTDDQSHRSDWKIGRIVKCISSDLNHGRRYVVQTGDRKEWERHHHSLVPLEMED